jgi:N-acetyl-1-D-myo-inositol-2-amino-2-deoxy-alpha-D-glucopyranoside deacetylase
MTATLPCTTALDPLVDVCPGDRWLVAVAHPDDESFGCGSLIARAASLGAEVVVACATRGEAGERTPGAGCCGDLGAVREGELRRAAGRLGVARVEVLGYRDSGFAGPIRPGTLCAAPVAEVAAVLRELVRDLAPTVVVVPDAGDGHRDHRQVRTAVRAALPSGPALYEYCLPNSLMRRWLDEMRALRPDTVYSRLDPSGIGRPDDQISHVVEVADLLPYREAAMAEHRSQASPFDGLSPELRWAFLSTDHLVRVPSAVLRSGSPRGGLR